MENEPKLTMAEIESAFTKWWGNGDNDHLAEAWHGFIAHLMPYAVTPTQVKCTCDSPNIRVTCRECGGHVGDL